MGVPQYHQSNEATMKASTIPQPETPTGRRKNNLEHLQTKLQQCKQAGWRGVVGSHRGSKTFQEIIRAIRRNRRDDYAKSLAARPKRKSARTTAVVVEE
jgi:hypothetical protein